MATAQNNTVIQFPTPGATWTQPTHVAIYDAGGTGGNQLLLQAISPALTYAPGSGDDVQIAANNLQVVLTSSGALTEEGAKDMLGGLLTAAARHCALMAGTNGDTELSGDTYARVSIPTADWTIA